MPKADGEIDNGEMDEVEKELEEFKRQIKDLFITTCTFTYTHRVSNDKTNHFFPKVNVYTNAHLYKEPMIVSNQINIA